MRRAAALLVAWIALVGCAAARTLPVEIADLSAYTYKDVFSLAAPAGWRTHDQSNGQRAILAWTDKTGNGAMRVTVLDQPGPLDTRQQERYLRTFLKAQFGRFPQFRLQTGRGRTGLMATWSYLATGTGNRRAALQGRSFLFQRGRRTAILTLAVPAEQFNDLQDRVQKIASSFVLMGGRL